MSKKEGPRMLQKLIPGTTIIYNEATDTWSISTAFGSSEGWTITPTGVLEWRGYIDMHGYIPEDMVISPTAVQLQYGAHWASNGATLNDQGAPVYLQYAVTTHPVQPYDAAASPAGIGASLAGFLSLGDDTDTNQVIFGGNEVWSPGPEHYYALQRIVRNQFGDGPSIVGPRVYVAIRAYLTIPRGGSPVDDTSGSWIIPPMRFVIAGDAQELPEYELFHLMAQQYDYGRRG